MTSQPRSLHLIYSLYCREDEPVKGSRASLTSTIKLDSEDEGSLNEYGDIDTGKFNEDGSFIGKDFQCFVGFHIIAYNLNFLF